MLLLGGCKATLHRELFHHEQYEKSPAEDIPTPSILWWRITFISKQRSHRTQHQGRKWSYSCRWLVQPHTICGGALVISQARNALDSWKNEQWAGWWKFTSLEMEGPSAYTQHNYLDKYEQDMFLVESALPLVSAVHCVPAVSLSLPWWQGLVNSSQYCFRGSC